jgi:hypothetical protein
MKKASQTRCLTFAPYARRRFTPCGVMQFFSLFAKPVLINFKKVYKKDPALIKAAGLQIH